MRKLRKERQAEDLETNQCRKRQKGVQTSEIDSKESGCESESGSNSEGQKDVYRIAAARDRAGKDIGQIRTIKSATGEVLMKYDYIRERWASISAGS